MKNLIKNTLDNKLTPAQAAGVFALALAIAVAINIIGEYIAKQ
jgi:hypothetical protein